MAGAAAVLPLSTSIAALHQPVASALNVYSKMVATKPTTDGAVHLVASIDDLHAFTNRGIQLGSLQQENVHADGNTLSFTRNGTTYRIENVLPQNFAQAIA